MSPVPQEGNAYPACLASRLPMHGPEDEPLTANSESHRNPYAINQAGDQLTLCPARSSECCRCSGSNKQGCLSRADRVSADETHFVHLKRPSSGMTVCFITRATDARARGSLSPVDVWPKGRLPKVCWRHTAERPTNRETSVTKTSVGRICASSSGKLGWRSAPFLAASSASLFARVSWASSRETALARALCALTFRILTLSKPWFLAIRKVLRQMSA